MPVTPAPSRAVVWARLPVRTIRSFPPRSTVPLTDRVPATTTTARSAWAAGVPNETVAPAATVSVENVRATTPAPAALAGTATRPPPTARLSVPPPGSTVTAATFE